MGEPTMPLTLKQVRAAIEEEHLDWQTVEGRSSQKVVPKGLGADPEGLPRDLDIPNRNLEKILDPGANPFLATRRLQRGFVTAAAVTRVFPEEALMRTGYVPTGGAGGEPPAGGAAAAIDWRSRFGRNWITTIRDQNPCSACWAFAGVALVEAMVSIEDSTWVRLSEGDIHRGVGSPCANGNNLGTVSTFLSTNGLADPGCFPWATNDPPYTPT